MTEHTTGFHATRGGLDLTNAILLYQSSDSRLAAPAFASVHKVECGADGNPIIAAGTPLSRAHLRQWTEALGRTQIPEILPANVLVAHRDLLAWWTPEAVRPGYFALSSPPFRAIRFRRRAVHPRSMRCAPLAPAMVLP